MNMLSAETAVQWLFLDLNAFFASCEQQETPALRGKPIIVVQTMTDSACAIAIGYPAKRLGITTGTLVREARRICADVIPVQARHRLYTDYHERILTEVDSCLPVEKVLSIDEMACRLMGTERQMPAAREPAVGLRGHHQSDDDLHTIRSVIARVPKPPLVPAPAFIAPRGNW